MAHIRKHSRPWRVWATLMLPVLLAGCAHYSEAFMPDPGALPVEDGKVTQADCGKLLEPSTFHDGPYATWPRASIPFGCATIDNLAQMVANPRDLISPRPYAGQAAGTAGAAVQRYDEGKVTPFVTGGSSTTSVSTGSSQNSAPQESNTTTGTGKGD